MDVAEYKSVLKHWVFTAADDVREKEGPRKSLLYPQTGAHPTREKRGDRVTQTLIVYARQALFVQSQEK